MHEASKVPVAIVGGGTIAPYHAKYLMSSPTTELIAIIDPFSSGQVLAQKLNVQHFKTVAELTSSSTTTKPEIYYVCVPSSLHVTLATEVLNNSSAKIVLVEKPLSTDSISGQQLLTLAKSKSCKIAAGHHRRFHPAVRTAKAAIVAGKVGNITAISGLWACKKNDNYFNLAWRTSRSSGGGPIWTNFVHDIDLLHYLVGSTVTRVWVTSTLYRRNHTNVKPNDTVVEEGAAIMFQFLNGVVGTFIVSDNIVSPFGWEIATGENPLHPKADIALDCFRVMGTQGSLTVPDCTLWTYRKQDADERGLEVGWHVPIHREQLEVQEGIPFLDQAEHLVRVLRDQEPVVCSGDDGLVAVKVCEAIIGALDKGDGMPVNIE